MRADQLNRLAALFEHARGLEPKARTAYLDHECADERELRAQVIALLDRHDRGGLLDDPIRPTDESAEPAPERIGHFRILDSLGRGGMGVVYRAEQDQPRRQIALKMMHTGLVTDELRRRFEFETNVLARLQHPGIAHIYEAGTSDAGGGPRPFFAMELVDGVPLDNFIGQSRALAQSERQRRIAQAINDFLNEDLLGKANPYGGASHDTKLRDVLDQAGESIETRFEEEPLVHASIRATLGRTNIDLGDYEKAERHLTKAVEIYDRERGAAHRTTMEIRHELIQAKLKAWDLDGAEEMIDDLLPRIEALFGKDHPLAGLIQLDLGQLRSRQGRYGQSAKAYRRALEIQVGDDNTSPRRIAVTKQT